MYHLVHHQVVHRCTPPYYTPGYTTMYPMPATRMLLVEYALPAASARPAGALGSRSPKSLGREPREPKN